MSDCLPLEEVFPWLRKGTTTAYSQLKEVVTLPVIKILIGPALTSRCCFYYEFVHGTTELLLAFSSPDGSFKVVMIKTSS